MAPAGASATPACALSRSRRLGRAEGQELLSGKRRHASLVPIVQAWSIWPLGEGVVPALALINDACGNAQHLQLAAPCHDTQAAAQLVAVETAAARVEDVDVGWLPLCPLEMTLLAQLAVQRVGAGEAELAIGQHRHVAAHCAQGLVHRRSIDGRRRITFDGHLRSVNGRCLGLHLNVDGHCVSIDGHRVRLPVARKLGHLAESKASIEATHHVHLSLIHI